MKNTLVLAAFLLLAPAVAHAGGSAGSIGVGAEYNLFSLGGASVNFDQGDFHVGGFLGFSDGDTPGDNTEVTIGGRFWWHVHSTAMSDFSVGGSLGMLHEDESSPPANDDHTDFYIDLGAQIRAFVTSNVALSTSLGLGIAAGDADGVILTGQPVLIAGVHYYFF